MKKLRFLLILGVGFLLGSKAGSGPYEQLEAKVRALGSRAEVQDALGKVKTAAQDQVDTAAHRVGQEVSDRAGNAEGSGSESSRGAASGARQAG